MLLVVAVGGWRCQIQIDGGHEQVWKREKQTLSWTFGARTPHLQLEQQLSYIKTLSVLCPFSRYIATSSDIK